MSSIPASVRTAHSLTAIVERLERLASTGGPRIGLAVEPMDVERDKRGSVGYVGEAVALARDLAGGTDQSSRDVRLICDTAHLRLNDESAGQLLSAAPDLVAALHLCNCCLDPGHELYGDKHIRPGRPGEFDLVDFADVIATARAAATVRPLPTFIEYRNHGDVAGHLAYLAEVWATLEARSTG